MQFDSKLKFYHYSVLEKRGSENLQKLCDEPAAIVLMAGENEIRFGLEADGLG